MEQQRYHFFREDVYGAEIEATYIDNNTPSSPIVDKEEVFKTDRVRLALRRGDVKTAANEAKVFELPPLAGD